MKIAVVAANGKSGKLITNEAVSRGHDVTAFVRHENRTSARHAVQKDILSLTADDLAGFDAVVDAFGAWTPEDLHLHTDTLGHLADILAGTNVHLYVVGGAGGLFTDASRTTHVYETPDFPEIYRPLSSAQAKSFDVALSPRKDVVWTYVCPAGEFLPDGPRSGKYELYGDVFTVNAKGESVMSYADYAIGMVDLIEDGGHKGERVSLNGAA